MGNSGEPTSESTIGLHDVKKYNINFYSKKLAQCSDIGLLWNVGISQELYEGLHIS